jgi:hypothetical protein
LVGWSEAPFLPVNLIDTNSETLDLTAHIINLPAPIIFTGKEPVTLPPGMFQWELIDFNYSRPQGPYDIYLDLGGELQMKYNLDDAIHFSDTVGLTLYLEGDQYSSNTLMISLWDFTEETWDQIPVGWGRNPISDFKRFVREQGEIRMRVENSAGQSGIYIERLDFSMTVIP